MILSLWQNFYVIAGAAAGTLIGVQFVVIALIASTHTRSNMESVGAFGTPTVVHLCGALIISAIMCAPWPSLFATAVALAVLGLAGLGYVLIVVRRARRQTIYRPVLEDWFWHAILPCAIYAALAVGALALTTFTQAALFTLGGAALCLLLIGIHNAWDTVTHIVFSGTPADENNSEAKKSE
jgi:hypothetical protein